MKGRRLTAQAAVKLFAQFFEENGAEAMGNSFGWDHAPQQLSPNEIVWEFTDGAQVGEETVDAVGTDPGHTVPVVKHVVVGFGILQMNVRDASDTEAMTTVGVFKAHRRKGYWHAITAWLIRKAQHMGADYCSRYVNEDNAEHYKRSMREAYSDDTKWIHAGDIWFPHHMGYFVYPFDEDEVKAFKKNHKKPKGVE